MDLIQSDWCPKRKLRPTKRHQGSHAQREQLCEEAARGDCLQAKETGLRGNKLASTLTLDLQFPQL